MEDERALCRDGADWLGRQKPLSDQTFRRFFGVYPKTVAKILSLSPNLNRKWLLRGLWWLKEYPTDEEIKNFQSGVSFFRSKRKEVIECLDGILPAVSTFVSSYSSPTIHVLFFAVTICRASPL